MYERSDTILLALGKTSDLYNIIRLYGLQYHEIICYNLLYLIYNSATTLSDI